MKAISLSEDSIVADARAVLNASCHLQLDSLAITGSLKLCLIKPPSASAFLKEAYTPAESIEEINMFLSH